MTFHIQDILRAREVLLDSARFLHGARVIDDGLHKAIIEEVGIGMQPHYVGGVVVFPPKQAHLNLRRADGSLVELPGAVAAGRRPLTAEAPVFVSKIKSGEHAIGNGPAASDAAMRQQEFLAKVHAAAAAAAATAATATESDEDTIMLTPTLTVATTATIAAAASAAAITTTTTTTADADNQFVLVDINDNDKNKDKGKDITAAPAAGAGAKKKKKAKDLVAAYGLEGLTFSPSPSAAPAPAVMASANPPKKRAPIAGVAKFNPNPNLDRPKGWVPPHLRDREGRPLPGVVSKYN